MPLQSVIVVNTAPGCDNLIEQQISADTCNNYIVRITPNTNAIGPFDVYVDTTGSTPVYSAQTRTQMLNGVVVQLGPCITPTPTPTPSITPTPGVTPTQTQTPSETPTNTPTPSITPSASETPTPTPSFTSTPTQTPTFTPSETPTETPTQTPTETSTQTPTQTPTQTETPTQTTTPTTTPTPTPTESIFIIAVSLQNGEDLLLQGGEPLLVQQPGVPFLVSGGDVTCPTTPVSLTQTIYGLGTSWGDNINIFFTDINLTTPFNGGNLFYTNDSAGCGTCYQIDTNGYTSNYGSPC